MLGDGGEDDRPAPAARSVRCRPALPRRAPRVQWVPRASTGAALLVSRQHAARLACTERCRGLRIATLSGRPGPHWPLRHRGERKRTRAALDDLPPPPPLASGLSPHGHRLRPRQSANTSPAPSPSLPASSHPQPGAPWTRPEATQSPRWTRTTPCIRARDAERYAQRPSPSTPRLTAPSADPRGGQGFRAWYAPPPRATLPPSRWPPASCARNADLSQLATDGTSTASVATRATCSSTRTPTCCCSATARSSATTAHTAATTAATRSKTSPS